MSQQDNNSHKGSDPGRSRRQSVKKILGAGGLAAGGHFTSGAWVTPVVDAVVLPAHADMSGPSCMSATGRTGSFHIEVGGSDPEAYDLDAGVLTTESDSAADIRLGKPPEVSLELLGYRLLVGLNGATLALFGIVDPDSVDYCAAIKATYSDSAALPSPYTGSVVTVRTSGGLVVRLLITNLDFSAPNGLFIDYVVLESA